MPMMIEDSVETRVAGVSLSLSVIFDRHSKTLRLIILIAVEVVVAEGSSVTIAPLLFIVVVVVVVVVSSESGLEAPGLRR